MKQNTAQSKILIGDDGELLEPRTDIEIQTPERNRQNFSPYFKAYNDETARNSYTNAATSQRSEVQAPDASPSAVMIFLIVSVWIGIGVALINGYSPRLKWEVFVEAYLLWIGVISACGYVLSAAFDVMHPPENRGSMQEIYLQSMLVVIKSVVLIFVTLFVAFLFGNHSGSHRRRSHSYGHQRGYRRRR